MPLPTPASPLLTDIESRVSEILTLVEGLDSDSLARSRLTRAAVTRRLAQIAACAAALPADERARMLEIDWAQWTSVGGAIARDEITPHTLWSAAQALCAETLQWLRVYQSDG